MEGRAAADARQAGSRLRFGEGNDADTAAFDLWTGELIMLALPPTHSIQGRSLIAAAMGGVHGRALILRLVDWLMHGKIDRKSLITAQMLLEQINEGCDTLKRGEGIGSVVEFA